MCRGSTRVYVHRLNFWYNNFFYVFFFVNHCKKTNLCMWISAYPLAENDFFLNVPHLFWIWDFEDMYLTHLEQEYGESHSISTSKNGFFWPSKVCIPLGQWEKSFFVNFECYNLANSEEWVCKMWWTCRHRS
jgi:hypothetical protein